MVSNTSYTSTSQSMPSRTLKARVSAESHKQVCKCRVQVFSMSRNTHKHKHRPMQTLTKGEVIVSRSYGNTSPPPSRARSGLTTPTAGAETKLSLFHGVCARAPSQAAWPPRKSDASFQALHTWIEANVRRKHGGPTQVGGQTKRQAARGHRDLAFMQLVSAEFPDAVNSPDMLAASPCYNFSS